MRALMLLAVVGLGLTPGAVATPGAPPVLVVSALDEDVTLLSWSPVPGATAYAVYRGPTEDRMVLIGVTDLPFFLDDRPMDGLYRVLANDGSESNSGQGGCVHKHGSDVSVSTNCVGS